VKSLEWKKANEIVRWSMEMMGYPPRPYILDRGALQACVSEREIGLHLFLNDFGG
jgi:hypothetical protein